MTLHAVTALAMAVWLSITAGGALSGAPSVEGGRVVAALMFLVGSSVMSLGFFWEARKAEKLIRECVGAAPPSL
jgi:hypothetical protein